MARKSHIDDILEKWPYEPNSVSVRIVPGRDGRDVIQMRIEMGLLQLEIEGRPDGDRPGGFDTYFAYLQNQCSENPAMQMTEEQCSEADREFVQFYHRRICWLAIREFENAMRDADHTLGLMDFCQKHSPDENWTMTHEQYRPFVLFHRTQAATLCALAEDNAEAAIEAVNQGLQQLHTLFRSFESEEFDENELVMRLVELRESVREKFSVGRTLEEQLGDAIASEQYELAAQLRDQLADRRNR
ncbi:MAG: UvrB/UvrC motif-containing protein [Planctomycetales bacterium]|nr:UvrB/UvrC motif-containing protein [Planctomycetales bacterium]MCA9171008.1 UvrB/UvrC motif-containing protein [Planctomycetales bacterium]